jgi:hypothetical protein
VSYSLSSLDVAFSRCGLGNVFVSAGLYWFLARIGDDETDDTPEGIFQHLLVVADPVGPQQAHCYEAEGKVDERQSKVHGYGGPSIFAGQLLESL